MSGKVLWTVFRSGGEYTEEHVVALARNLYKIHPDALLGVISDKMLTLDNPGAVVWTAVPDVTYPGWWMKMAMFKPGLMDGEDMLYCDLDTVLTGPLDDLWAAEGDIVLRDFYRGGNGIGSGLMRLTPKTRASIWEYWIQNPKLTMGFHQSGGDQQFLERVEFMMQSVDRETGMAIDPAWQLFRRWQDVLPGAVCSYKVHIRDEAENVDKLPPAGTKVCCFHGVPRPWRVNQEWIINARA